MQFLLDLKMCRYENYGQLVKLHNDLAIKLWLSSKRF